MSSPVFIFGNPDVSFDSLPIRILPKLRATFPSIQFEIKDPNEEWNVPEELVVIDVAAGIDEVTVFSDLKKFASSPRVGIHDFDALTNLRYLQKLGKIKKVTVIALPMDMEEGEALEETCRAIRTVMLAPSSK